MTLYRKELRTVKEIWNPDVARKLLRKLVRQKVRVHKRQAKGIAEKNYRATLTCGGGQVGLDAINLDERARRFSFKDRSSVAVRTAHGSSIMTVTEGAGNCANTRENFTT